MGLGKISIHALLAESDDKRLKAQMCKLLFLSTLSLRRATLANSTVSTTIINFYPRSPCGERRKKSPPMCSMRHFYPRSPCGERPCIMTITTCTVSFLSTLSLRRATLQHLPCGANSCISIHALLAESDPLKATKFNSFHQFLSTLSLRRATRLGLLGWLRVLISIHALLAESDDVIQWEGMKSLSISIHALLAESDPV